MRLSQEKPPLLSAQQPPVAPAPARLSGQGLTWPGVASLRPQLGWSEGHDKVTGAGCGCSLALGVGGPAPRGCGRSWWAARTGAMGAGAHPRCVQTLSGLVAGRSRPLWAGGGPSRASAWETQGPCGRRLPRSHSTCFRPSCAVCQALLSSGAVGRSGKGVGAFHLALASACFSAALWGAQKCTSLENPPWRPPPPLPCRAHVHLTH